MTTGRRMKEKGEQGLNLTSFIREDYNPSSVWAVYKSTSGMHNNKHMHTKSLFNVGYGVILGNGFLITFSHNQAPFMSLLKHDNCVFMIACCWSIHLAVKGYSSVMFALIFDAFLYRFQAFCWVEKLFMYTPTNDHKKWYCLRFWTAALQSGTFPLTV